MTDQNTSRRALPIELSSVVTSLETLTRELTKKLTPDEVTQVISELCERLRSIPEERRAPDRPFTP